MPPRSSSSLTTPFPGPDPDNEVVCPLLSQDGTACRKRCFGEKRYRSMQEHIRRAHPEHYLPKLPATAESFQQMINSEPHEPIVSNSHHASPQQPTPTQDRDTSSYANTSMLAPNNHFRRGSLLQSANAAAALAQLHNSRPEPDWHGQGHQDAFGEPDTDHDYMHNYFAHDGGQDMFAEPQQPLDISHLQHPGLDRIFSARSSSLQPFPRRPNRPRKASVTENARKGKHDRDKSKDLKRLSHDRKAISVEPSHKRWEDLLDAAQSATEEESRDLTPIPQSPRSSMPPFQGQNQTHFHSYTASPLQNTLLPQESTDDSTTTPFNHSGLEPFPSVESSYDPSHSNQPYHTHQSSGDSAHSNLYSAYSRHHASSTGSTFHLAPDGLSSSPPHNSTNAGFARPQSAATNTHFPHPLHAAHLAQQQAVATANSVQGHRPHNPYSVHQNSYSTASSSLSNNGHHAHLQDPSPPTVQHFCAACQRLTSLSSSYACQECICGVCRDCFDVLMSMDSANGPGCPRCRTSGGRFKPFNLDLK